MADTNPDLLNRSVDSAIVRSRSRAKTDKKGNKDQIVINPPEKLTQSEAVEKTAVLAFGRMNPPTTGHEKLIKKVSDEAKKRNASAHVFVSHTQDKKKNPLSQEDKIKYVKKVAPEEVNVRGSSKENPTPLHAAKQLHDEGHQHLVIVAGEDRAQELHDRISKYNGHPDHYNFKSISVVSSGQRDPDAEGEEGMSGTKMREHAKANDHESFKSGLPKALHPHAKEIMSKVRGGMRLDESMLNELDVAARVKKAMTLRRYRAKVSQFRERSVGRQASQQNLRKKALRYARLAIKQRLMGTKGVKYSGLAPADKKAIDQSLNRRVGLIRQIATRITPRVKQAELARFVSARGGKPGAGTKSFFKGKIQVQNFDALLKKSEQSNIPFEILHEVFMRGYQSWSVEKNKTQEQCGFERVNSFVNKGKTYFNDDSDLVESALDQSDHLKIQRLVSAGLVDGKDKQHFLSILSKLRVLDNISKLQLQDQKFLVQLYDELMDYIIDDNQLFNRMLQLLRRK